MYRNSIASVPEPCREVGLHVAVEDQHVVTLHAGLYDAVEVLDGVEQLDVALGLPQMQVFAAVALPGQIGHGVVKHSVPVDLVDGDA